MYSQIPITPYVPKPIAGILMPLFNVISGTFAIFFAEMIFVRKKKHAENYPIDTENKSDSLLRNKWLEQLRVDFLKTTTDEVQTPL